MEGLSGGYVGGVRFLEVVLLGLGGGLWISGFVVVFGGAG